MAVVLSSVRCSDSVSHADCLGMSAKCISPEKPVCEMAIERNIYIKYVNFYCRDEAMGADRRDMIPFFIVLAGFIVLRLLLP